MVGCTFTGSGCSEAEAAVAPLAPGAAVASGATVVPGAGLAFLASRAWISGGIGGPMNPGPGTRFARPGVRAGALAPEVESPARGSCEAGLGGVVGAVRAGSGPFAPGRAGVGAGAAAGGAFAAGTRTPGAAPGIAPAGIGVARAVGAAALVAAFFAAAPGTVGVAAVAA